MVLDQLRPGSERVLVPIARVFAKLGLTPNGLTAISLVAGFAAGAALFLSSEAQPWWLLAAAALIGVNALTDAADGALARLTNASSRLGDLLDHVVDRYADLAILVGLTLSTWVDVRIGVFAIVGTTLTSYMGTQAQALGLGRNYGGLLGRADRIAMIAAAILLEFLRVMLGYGPVFGLNLLTIVMIWIAFAGNVTALQRIVRAVRDLQARPTE